MSKKINFNNFKELLDDYEPSLTTIKNGLFIHSSIQKERIKTSPYEEIKNNIIIYKHDIKDGSTNYLIRTSYDMLIIELCSLAEGICYPNGFFDQVENNFLPELNNRIISNLIEINNEPDPFFKDSDIQFFNRSFEDLFGTKLKPISKNLLSNVRSEFFTLIDPLMKDRNIFRAHKYEKNKGQTNKYPKLTMETISSQFHLIENLFNGFKMIYERGFRTYGSEVLFRNSESSAKDIVDILNYGGIQSSLEKFECNIIPLRGNKWHYQFREEFYNLQNNRKNLIRALKKR